MAGMSQQALADATGRRITKQAISKYEKGLMKPDSQNLIALANALEVSTGYFYRKKRANLANLEFRKKSKLVQGEKERIKARAMDFLARYMEIEELTGLKAEFKNPLEGWRLQSTEDVEKVAGYLREKWVLGQGPIPNLMELCEDKGIRIYEIEADKGFDGLSAWADGTPAVIINKNKDLVRKRLTVAHELGHILAVFEEETGSEKEKLCQAFAGAFLLPGEAIIEELGARRKKITLWELKKLKGIYGISVQAIVVRAYQLGIIKKGAYNSFWFHANKYGWRKDDPGEYNGKEKGNRFNQLVYRAVAEDIITMAKGAELMNVKLSHFRDRFQLAA